MSNKKPFKLNIWALTNNIKDGSINISNSKTKETTNVTPVYQKKNKSPLEKILDNNLNTEKTHNLDLSEMKLNKQEKLVKISEKDTEKISTPSKEAVKTKEVFLNYESEFNREKETILEKIKKIKKTLKPKTRLGFIMLLIWVTIVWILILFIYMPTIHNLNNYKYNLLLAIEKGKCKLDTTQCKVNTIEKEYIVEKELVILYDRVLNKENFIIKYKTKIINWKEVILFEWKIYNSLEEFNKTISLIIENKKIGKLQDHFLKNYE